MQREFSQSTPARAALDLVTELQSLFVSKLEQVAEELSIRSGFSPVEWLRDNGTHGGGVRFCAGEDDLFNRASVNVSQIHYDDDSSKNLGSATALSTIIHPQNPHAPSIHMHISWTEMKDGNGYWRVMADLNPSIPNPADTQTFIDCLQQNSGDLYAAAAAQGDRYFNIPALGRHRGVAHFYLEQHKTDNPAEDFNFAKEFGSKVIDGYTEILRNRLQNSPEISLSDRAAQLDYHTLYLFQVLTLDRGTTSGLLVHSQNDLGIMGSIPARVSKPLLESWIVHCAAPQDALVRSLLAALPEGEISPVTDAAKLSLAQAVRTHYQANPEALALQARGNTVPPTVDNHR